MKRPRRFREVAREAASERADKRRHDVKNRHREAPMGRGRGDPARFAAFASAVVPTFAARRRAAALQTAARQTIRWIATPGCRRARDDKTTPQLSCVWCVSWSLPPPGAFATIRVNSRAVPFRVVRVFRGPASKPASPASVALVAQSRSIAAWRSVFIHPDSAGAHARSRPSSRLRPRFG